MPVLLEETDNDAEMARGSGGTAPASAAAGRLYHDGLRVRTLYDRRDAAYPRDLSVESFSGQYVHMTSTTTADTLPPAFGDAGWPAWGPFDTPWYDGTGYTTVIRNYSGKVVATLFGDRGDTMRCRFR